MIRKSIATKSIVRLTVYEHSITHEIYTDWIGFSSVLRLHRHSIGCMEDGFYRSKDPRNSIKVLKEKATKENPEKEKNRKYTIHNKERHIKHSKSPSLH